jgi:molybdate transport system regulatory protein
LIIGDGMKTSARNQLQGKIVSVEKGDVASLIKIQIETPVIVTSMITTESVRDLDLKKGDTVRAIIKSSSVMILKD